MSNAPSDERLSELYTGIGKITSLWALMEQALDAWVGIVFHSCGGRKLRNGLPHGLKRKLEFLRTGFKQIPDLAPFKDDGLVLLEKIASNKDRRHDVVHGAISAVEAETGKFTFAILDARGDMHYASRKSLTHSDFQASAELFQELAFEVAIFAHRLAAQFLK